MEEKVGLFGAVGLMWKNIFNYKGTATRREYWNAVLFQTCVIVFTLMLFVLFYIGGTENKLLKLIISVFGAYVILGLIPWLSLTVRRLRETGRNGWWSVLVFVIGVGTVIVMLWCAQAPGAGSFFPSHNMEMNVYGPAPFDEVEPKTPTPSLVPDEFEPSDNEPSTVYGPPEWFEDEEVEPFKPEDNDLEEVYGPPEWFE